MATDNEVTSSDSPQRVAFDLMKIILSIEKGLTKENARFETLKLYRECLAIVDGGLVDDVLKSKSRTSKT